MTWKQTLNSISNFVGSRSLTRLRPNLIVSSNALLRLQLETFRDNIQYLQVTLCWDDEEARVA